MKFTFIYLLLFGIYIFSCSKVVEENNSGVASMKPAENVSINSEVIPQATPSPLIKSSPPNPRDVVFFDGTNYIKKSGWKKPSKKDTYIDEYDVQDDPFYFTKSGKKIKTKTLRYITKEKYYYSEDFYYEGGELDYMKGKLELYNFDEMSANGKVFVYFIMAKKVLSLDDPPETPFGYQIMDTDGDGIFETLVYADERIVVPNWVLK